MTEEASMCEEQNLNRRLPPFLIGVMIFDYVHLNEDGTQLVLVMMAVITIMMKIVLLTC